jgi:hypothetical protein
MEIRQSLGAVAVAGESNKQQGRFRRKEKKIIMGVKKLDPKL